MNEYRPETLYWKLLKALAEKKDLAIDLDSAVGLANALDSTLPSLKPTNFDDSYGIVRSGFLRKYEDDLSMTFSGCSCADECVDREACELVLEAGRDKVMDIYGELVGAAQSLSAACGEEYGLHIDSDTFVLGRTMVSPMGIDLDHQRVPGFSSTVTMHLKENVASITLVDWNDPYTAADLDNQGENCITLKLSAKFKDEANG